MCVSVCLSVTLDRTTGSNRTSLKRTEKQFVLLKLVYIVMVLLLGSATIILFLKVGINDVGTFHRQAADASA